MQTYDKTWPILSMVAIDRRRVADQGTWAGSMPDPYFERCRAYHQPTGTLMIFSRDVGYHTSGWWKNPDYERCYHLSLSFYDPGTRQLAPRDRKLTADWVKFFFGPNADKLWCESPYSAKGKAAEVWHYRLFCSPFWTPIIPRGEVYSRELTEAGWLSYSDVQARLAEESARRAEREVLPG